MSDIKDKLIPLPTTLGKLNIPDDIFNPVYNYIPERQSTQDSLARGYWVWRKMFIGYVGKYTGVMLAPDWGDVLEARKEV